MKKGEGVPQIDIHKPSPATPTKDRRRRFPRRPLSVHEGQDPSTFCPLEASFGPYHWATNKNDKKKDHCFDHCKRRTNKSIQCFRDALNMMIDDLWNEYDISTEDEKSIYYGKWEIEGLKREQRLDIMIKDGCYMLEIMFAAQSDVSNDSKFFKPDESKTFMRDMLLVENQIPLELLKALVPILYPEKNEEFLKKLVVDFFSLPPVPGSKWSESAHILEFYRASLLTRDSVEDAQAIDIPSEYLHFYIPSATELEDASIEIGTNSRKKPLNISFSDTSSCKNLFNFSFSNPTLLLPQIDLGDMNKSIFHNLILFERLDPGLSNEFSSYMYFMNHLLKGPEDVRLLRARGIINTTLREDEVVHLFDKLCKDIGSSPDEIMKDWLLLDIGQKLRYRYNKNSRVWRKDLFQTYLKSPWAVISIIAALLIFGFSALQTVYTVLSYYNH